MDNRKEAVQTLEKIQREAFEQDKQAKIAQAIASGALAIIQALATLGPIGGPIAAIGIGATTVFQIAKIKAATFAALPTRVSQRSKPRGRLRCLLLTQCTLPRTDTLAIGGRETMMNLAII